MAIVEQQIDDRVLHVDRDAQMDGVVLQRANQLQAGAIADVREARVAVAAEVALVDAAVRGAIEHGAPRLELADAIGRLCAWSSAIRQLLTYWPPRIVSAKCTCQLSRSSLLPIAAAMPPSAITVCALPSKRLADEADRDASRGSFDRGAQAGAAGADDQHVVAIRVRRAHQNSLRSVITPIEQRRT